MLAEAASALVGSPSPRIGPPLPLRHGLAGYRERSATLDIEPMPWQDTAASYLTATDADGIWTFRDVAVVVGRQNGKTTLLKALIVQRLLEGRKVMHIAQVRELPRIMFETIADALEATDSDLFPRRRGKIIWPRRGAGSESIVLTNGGTYRIAAAVTGSARGHSIDDLLIDELREMDSFDVINAAKPAQRFSENPQTIYLSNAGTDDSVVLNALRLRGESGDPSLAYLEWSADPDYDPGDVRGWVQANPSIGHFPQVLRDLEKDYTAAKLGGNMAGFETEALCRWVKTMRPALVTNEEWNACEAGRLPTGPHRTFYAVSMDPDGSRACLASAWLAPDGVCYLSLDEDVRGDPVSTGDLGNAWRVAYRGKVAFDPMTDRELVKFFKLNKSVTGGEFSVATSNFVNHIRDGKLRWTNAQGVGDDLAWTSRKDTEKGSFQAVRANDDRPIPAALAAIRAVWLATGLPRRSLRVS